MGKIGRRRDPGIVEGVDHQGRHGNAVEELPRGVPRVVILRAGKAVARRDEALIEFPDAAAVGDGGTLAGSDLGALAQALQAHRPQQIALIKRIARAPDLAGAGREIPESERARR